MAGMVIYCKFVPAVKTDQAGKVIRLNGVGFRGFSWANYVVLSIGYAHYLAIMVDGVVRLRKTRIAVELKRTLQRVVDLRLPDPYKQRGLLEIGRSLKKKEGKKR